MKSVCYYSRIKVASVLLLLLATGLAKRTPHSHSNDEEHTAWPSHTLIEAFNSRERRPRRKMITFEIAGSRIPDCLHACGSCSPCRLVMVHFGCSSLAQAAEACPMAYKCICSSKSYPVP